MNWKDELKKKSVYSIHHKERLVDYTGTKYPSLRLAEKAFKDLRCSEAWEIKSSIGTDEVIPIIHSLLKQQREICAEAYIKQRDYHVARTITSDCILNAPEPKELNK